MKTERQLLTQLALGEIRCPAGTACTIVDQNLDNIDRMGAPYGPQIVGHGDLDDYLECLVFKLRAYYKSWLGSQGVLNTLVRDLGTIPIEVRKLVETDMLRSQCSPIKSALRQALVSEGLHFCEAEQEFEIRANMRFRWIATSILHTIHGGA